MSLSRLTLQIVLGKPKVVDNYLTTLENITNGRFLRNSFDSYHWSDLRNLWMDIEEPTEGNPLFIATQRLDVVEAALSIWHTKVSAVRVEGKEYVQNLVYFTSKQLNVALENSIEIR
jgi:hypothetical protein